MRIIAGAFKGRRLAPVQGRTRPTAAKVREAVFNILGPAVVGVRVPVFYSHSEAVNIETERKLTPDEARQILAKAPGVKVVDNLEKNEYPMPLDAAGQDLTLVGRIREDFSIANGLNFWVVADNLRKGAATNAVQIAELLIRDYLRK